MVPFVRWAVREEVIRMAVAAAMRERRDLLVEELLQVDPEVGPRATRSCAWRPSGSTALGR